MKKSTSAANHEFTTIWKSLLHQGLVDDDWQWDWTTLGTQKSAHRVIRARIIAKSQGVWAGGGLSHALPIVAQELGYEFQVKTLVDDGVVLKVGQVVSEWSAPARALLALERPFLNLASYSSGIATRTHGLVSQVKKTWAKIPGAKSDDCPRITSTRKTLPGYRDIGVYGVRVGGGFSHRTSLAGGVLIKENHIAAAGGIAKAITGVQREAPHGLRIETEVTSLDELKQAVRAGADGVLLDNFTPAMVIDAVKWIERSQPKLLVEVSGGLNEANIEGYVMKGVHILSIGSLTHSVKATDLSLLVQ